MRLLPLPRLLLLYCSRSIVRMDRAKSDIKSGTDEAGSKGLCKALQRLFSIFDVEISSDGGARIRCERN